MGGVEVELHTLLTSALYGGEWWACRLYRFISGERAPSTPLRRRLVGSQSRSGPGGEEKNFLPLPGI